MNPLHYHWRWELQSSPEKLWPLVADTDRFNRDMGLPEVETLSYIPKNEKFSVRRMRLKVPLLRVEWEEYPFEWNQPHSFGVERLYQQGPFKTLKISVQLQPNGSAGTSLDYKIQAEPRNKIGEQIIRFQIGVHFPRIAEKILRGYDSGIKKIPIKSRRLLSGVKKADSFIQSSKLAQNFYDWLTQSPDEEVQRIRPYALARRWKIPRQDLLRVCLKAVREGLLVFQWEIICPHCRGSEKAVPHLENIESQSYCQNCKTRFEVHFEKLVELTFYPHPSIRKINPKFFCTGGPRVSPHIVSQLLLRPQDSKILSLNLTEGIYMIRLAQSSLRAVFQVSSEGSKKITLESAADKITLDSDLWHSSPEIQIRNQSQNRQLLTIEKFSWTEDSVSARDVLHFPLFRDLFSAQCVRAGEKISFGNLTFVFTDLKASTQLYQEIGDPAAFSTVVHHFDTLRDIIREHEGILVKTIGDAVMAVFTHPAQALLAAASAQRYLSSPENSRPLFLKIGIHYGPALGVTLNQRLDYFGTAVNIAARLVGLSSGSDIILSSLTAEDPEVKFLMSTPVQNTRFEYFQTNIKGFGEENFSLIRFIPNCSKSH